MASQLILPMRKAWFPLTKTAWPAEPLTSLYCHIAKYVHILSISVYFFTQSWRYLSNLYFLPLPLYIERPKKADILCWIGRQEKDRSLFISPSSFPPPYVQQNSFIGRRILFTAEFNSGNRGTTLVRATISKSFFAWMQSIAQLKHTNSLRNWCVFVLLNPRGLDTIQPDTGKWEKRLHQSLFFSKDPPHDSIFLGRRKEE